MKTTARNQFPGKITSVQPGPVSTQIVMQIAGGHEIVATMTAASAERLKVAVGQEAVALIKSSAVVLVTNFEGYALSARNQFAGSVSRLDRGAVTSMVGVALPGGVTLTASVTNDAVDALDLKKGSAATAVFKAYSVMVATRA